MFVLLKGVVTFLYEHLFNFHNNEKLIYVVQLILFFLCYQAKMQSQKKELEKTIKELDENISERFQGNYFYLRQF